MSSPAVPAEVRERLGLALDIPDLAGALGLARLLAPWFGVAKVGPELFIPAGREAVNALGSEGFEVFLDLKLHDIPTTVGRGAEQAAALGATYLTVHAAGGAAMLRAAVEGFAGASAAPHGAAARAGVLAVTVLTSEADAAAATIRERAEAAAAAGCVGVVCAGGDLASVRAAVPDLLAVVPGIRLQGARLDDQGRVATPGAAVGAGAGLLVIGRTVTGAEDQVAAARRVSGEVEEALAGVARRF